MDFGSSMPTARFDLSVAVLNDTLYAMDGCNWTYSTPVNEQYFPSGYEANNPLSSPSPSPTPISTQEPFPTALLATASGASAAIVSFGLLVYFKKRKH